MPDLIQRSLAIIEAGQAPTGAYIASPNFPTYHYCWFRDGAFIAYAMDQWGRHESARRFYDWACGNIVARVTAVKRCLAAVTQNLPIDSADLLDTRYTLDGQTGMEQWPNFQLDGFGTLLWGMERHVRLTGRDRLPIAWSSAASLLIHYIGALWRRPNYDCWEEFPEHIAVSTLAAFYSGLHAVTTLAGVTELDRVLACSTTEQIRAFVLEQGTCNGHLIKHVNGADVVDGALLWACVPFGEHGLFVATEPVMRSTVNRVEQDLVGRTGGVHRYRSDTYYGGGEWLLLTALLGEYRACIGDVEGLQRCLDYIKSNANEAGELPEQIVTASLHPERIAEWIERWGSVAQPLLWSHANYLSLYACVMRLQKEHHTGI